MLDLFVEVIHRDSNTEPLSQTQNFGISRGQSQDPFWDSVSFNFLHVLTNPGIVETVKWFGIPNPKVGTPSNTSCVSVTADTGQDIQRCAGEAGKGQSSKASRL